MKIATMNIKLPEELANYVRSQVAEGHYTSVSDVMREAVRRLSMASRPAAGLFALSGEPFDPTKGEAAVRGILKLQKRQKLGRGRTIEGLINDGRDA